MTEQELIEKLADAAHEGWRKQYQKSGRHDKDYLDVPYVELSEEWKEYDRSTARENMPIIREYAEQVAAAERERCARAIENLKYPYPVFSAQGMQDHLAHRIRALGPAELQSAAKEASKP